MKEPRFSIKRPSRLKVKVALIENGFGILDNELSKLINIVTETHMLALYQKIWFQRLNILQSWDVHVHSLHINPLRTISWGNQIILVDTLLCGPKMMIILWVSKRFSVAQWKYRDRDCHIYIKLDIWTLIVTILAMVSFTCRNWNEFNSSKSFVLKHSHIKKNLYVTLDTSK